MPARNDGVNCDFCARTRDCPACDGTGKESDDALCEPCQGAGCDLCSHRGRVDAPTVCQTCQGRRSCPACCRGQAGRLAAGEPGWKPEPLPNVPVIKTPSPGAEVPPAAPADPTPPAKGSFDDGDE